MAGKVVLEVAKTCRFYILSCSAVLVHTFLGSGYCTSNCMPKENISIPKLLCQARSFCRLSLYKGTYMNVAVRAL